MQPVSPDHFDLTNRKDILRKFLILSQKNKECNCIGPIFFTFHLTEVKVIVSHGELIQTPVAGYWRGVSERLCGA